MLAGMGENDVLSEVILRGRRHFQCSFFVARAMFCENLLYHVLAQSSRDFVRVRSLSLWRGANFDMAHATVS